VRAAQVESFRSGLNRGLGRFHTSTRPRLKRLHRQALVITGATSGIGLVTARKAARAGARVFLIARSEEAARPAGAPRTRRPMSAIQASSPRPAIGRSNSSEAWTPG
jgi:hypothetical protein